MDGAERLFDRQIDEGFYIVETSLYIVYITFHPYHLVKFQTNISIKITYLSGFGQR